MNYTIFRGSMTKGGRDPFNQCRVFTITASFIWAEMRINTSSYSECYMAAVLMHLISHLLELVSVFSDN